jgi:hypothetical protein
VDNYPTKALQFVKSEEGLNLWQAGKYSAADLMYAFAIKGLQNSASEELMNTLTSGKADTHGRNRQLLIDLCKTHVIDSKETDYIIKMSYDVAGQTNPTIHSVHKVSVNSYRVSGY